MATGTGNLPYPMPPVSPFDVITSQAENERIANIESLADGTGIGDGAITAPKIDFATMKVCMPDYANKSATNLWQSSTTSTMASRGFAYAYVFAYDASSPVGASILVNGKEVSKLYAEQTAQSGARTGSMSIVIPINGGDIVSCTATGTIGEKTLNYIPERWV